MPSSEARSYVRCSCFPPHKSRTGRNQKMSCALHFPRVRNLSACQIHIQRIRWPRKRLFCLSNYQGTPWFDHNGHADRTLVKFRRASILKADRHSPRATSPRFSGVWSERMLSRCPISRVIRFYDDVVHVDTSSGYSQWHDMRPHLSWTKRNVKFLS